MEYRETSVTKILTWFLVAYFAVTAGMILIRYYLIKDKSTPSVLLDNGWYLMVIVLVIGALWLRRIILFKDKIGTESILKAPPLFIIALFFAVLGVAGFAIFTPLFLLVELTAEDWPGIFQWHLIWWSPCLIASFVVFQIARHRFKRRMI